jgi:hypothetical protein
MRRIICKTAADKDALIEALQKQARLLNWKCTKTFDQNGGGPRLGNGGAWLRKSYHFEKGNEEAVLWHDEATITLVRIPPPPTFESFIDLDHWVNDTPVETDDDIDAKTTFFRNIERFIIRMGQFMPLLEIEATDIEFFNASAEFKKRGYELGESHDVVAALLMDALERYKKRREWGLTFLAQMVGTFGKVTKGSDLTGGRQELELTKELTNRTKELTNRHEIGCKPRLTEFCEQASARLTADTEMDYVSIIRPDYPTIPKLKHQKRSGLIWLIITLAATEYWKEASKLAANPDWSVSENPFKKTNSDVIVAEALIFFWYCFMRYVARKKQQQQLTQVDGQAWSDVAAFMVPVIDQTTQWPIEEFLDARMNEYKNSDKFVPVFCRVVLRSLGKQAINDPDRSLDLEKEDNMSIWGWTAFYMVEKLPPLYKTMIERYPMD